MSNQAWKAFEREIVRRLKALGFEAKRNWAEQFMKSNTIDIIAKKKDVVYIFQCKYGVKPQLRQAYLEIVGAKRAKEIPIAVCRFSKDRDTNVILSWSDFIKLLTK